LCDERIQTVECVQIAENLRRQTLAIDNRFCDTRTRRILGET
jgi:hypothetical protein